MVFTFYQLPNLTLPQHVLGNSEFDRGIPISDQSHRWAKASSKWSALIRRRWHTFSCASIKVQLHSPFYVRVRLTSHLLIDHFRENQLINSIISISTIARISCNYLFKIMSFTRHEMRTRRLRTNCWYQKVKSSKFTRKRKTVLLWSGFGWEDFSYTRPIRRSMTSISQQIFNPFNYTLPTVLAELNSTA